MLVGFVSVGLLMLLMLWNKPIWPAYLSWLLMPVVIFFTLRYFAMPENLSGENVVDILWAATGMAIAFFGSLVFWATRRDKSEEKRETASIFARVWRTFFDPTNLSAKRKAQDESSS